VEIEVQWDELESLAIEGRPALVAGEIAKDRLQIPFVGEFQQKCSAW
jgi:hypothetical protein